MNDDETKFKEEAKEVMRLGSYIKEGGRLVKLRLRTQSATEILARTYRLRNIEECKDVFMKKIMNEEETKI